MFVYLITYIFSFLFAYLYSLAKDKYVSFLLKLLLFLVLFLPLALRYNIGTDYENYWQQLMWDVNIYENRWGGFELGWRPLIFLIKFFNLDVHWFFVIVAFFSVYFVLKIVDKKYIHYAMIIYVSTLYLDSFSLIRQAFAAIIVVYGVDLYFKTLNKKYLWICVLSVMFHTSMILFVLLLPFIFKFSKIKPFSKVTVLCLLIFVYLFFTIINIPVMIFNIIAKSMFGSMSKYFSPELYGGATELGSGLGVLLKEIVVLPFIFCSTSVLLDGEKNRLYMPMLIINYLIIITYIFSTQITIMSRFPYIFTTFYFVSLKSLTVSKSKYKKIGLMLIVIFFTCNFYVNLLKNPSSARGGLGITPYMSIMEK